MRCLQKNKNIQIQNKMNVEFGDDNRFKKRVTERLKANFAEDKGFAPSLGSTAKDSKSFDGLDTACEEIETKAQLVANQLERDAVLRLQHPTEFSAPAGVAGFYAAVKKGINALKKTDFKGLPRTDIASLESYLERLSGFDFDAKFAELLLHFAPAAPIAGVGREQLLTDAINDAKQEIANETARYHTEMGDWDIYLQDRLARNKLVEVRETSRHTAIINQIGENIRTEEATLLKLEKELHGIQHSASSKVERTGLVQKDRALVVPAFKVDCTKE